MKKRMTPVLPDSLGGRFTVVISGLITNQDNKFTHKNLNDLFKITRGHREIAIREIHSSILVMRVVDEDSPNYPEEGFTRMKDTLAEYIAKHWEVKITPAQLEPKPQEWEELEDLTIPFDVAKLPKIKKSRKKGLEMDTLSVEEIVAEEVNSAQTPPDEFSSEEDGRELSIEERLARGDFDV